MTFRWAPSASRSTAGTSWEVEPGESAATLASRPPMMSAKLSMPESVRKAQTLGLSARLPRNWKRRASYSTPLAPSAWSSTRFSLKLAITVPSFGRLL